jgi:catechol 2,3-dioxygenase
MHRTKEIDPNLSIGSVELGVSDLARSADFYERVLGMPVIERETERASLGIDPARPALVLSEVADATPLPTRATGLFHVAWLHPTRADLADTVRRVAVERWPLEGASDHGVSEALYLSDPDGLGIEIYADRPRELWERALDGHRVRMVTLPLDLDDLLAQGDEQPAATIAAGTGVGHVHLKVADVPTTAAFYRDALGIAEQAQLPSAAFLGAGGYHHHVGLNSWQSQGAPGAPATAPGLRRIDFVLSDAAALEAVERSLAEDPSAPALVRSPDGQLTVRDPDDEQLTFTAADA